MTQSELVTRLYRRCSHLRQSDVARIVNTIFGEIAEALVRGDRVELRDFGVFTAPERGPWTCRDPRTGEKIQIDTARNPRFRAGKGLRAHINNGG